MRDSQSVIDGHEAYNKHNAMSAGRRTKCTYTYGMDHDLCIITRKG